MVSDIKSQNKIGYNILNIVPQNELPYILFSAIKSNDEQIYINLLHNLIIHADVVDDECILFLLESIFNNSDSVCLYSNKFFNEFYSFICSFYEVIKKDRQTSEGCFRILFRQKTSKCPIFAYKLSGIRKSADPNYRVLNDAKSFYLEHYNEFHSVYFDLLFKNYKKISSDLYMHLFENLDELTIFLMCKTLGPDVFISLYRKFIPLIADTDYLFTNQDDYELFEHLLLLSSIDRNEFNNILRILKNKLGSISNSLIRDSIECIIKNNAVPKASINIMTLKNSKLKIALCISGQLRGYKTAFATWDKLGIFDHSVDIYVQTWTNIGGKFPIPNHASRVFDGEFLKAYIRVFTNKPNLREYLAKHYKNFSELINRNTNRTSTYKELSDFYHTSNIHLLEDRRPEFANFSNPDKMYYNIYECDKLMSKSKIVYDLVIRIRPDLYITSISGNIDFFKVFNKSAEQDCFFTLLPYGLTYNFTPIWGYGCDDAFAIGVPSVMQKYAKTYCFNKNHRLYKLPSNLLGHRSLAYSSLYNGIYPSTLFDEYNTSFKLLDPDKISKTDILTALSNDSIHASSEIYNEINILTDAIKNDLAVKDKTLF